jgi:hypothetical protein
MRSAIMLGLRSGETGCGWRCGLILPDGLVD